MRWAVLADTGPLYAAVDPADQYYTQAQQELKRLEREGLLDDYHAAMSRIQRYRDQAFTLFDVVLAILSERLALPVWTYDHHFDVMRVPVWR